MIGGFEMVSPVVSRSMMIFQGLLLWSLAHTASAIDATARLALPRAGWIGDAARSPPPTALSLGELLAPLHDVVAGVWEAPYVVYRDAEGHAVAGDAVRRGVDAFLEFATTRNGSFVLQLEKLALGAARDFYDEHLLGGAWAAGSTQTLHVRGVLGLAGECCASGLTSFLQGGWRRAMPTAARRGRGRRAGRRPPSRSVSGARRPRRCARACACAAPARAPPPRAPSTPRR